MSNAAQTRVWGSGLRGNNMLIMVAIADVADDGGNAYPGVEYLAWKTGLVRSTIQAFFKKCRKELWLDADVGGGDRSTSCRICFEKLPKKEPWRRLKGRLPGQSGREKHPARNTQPTPPEIPSDPARITEAPRPNHMATPPESPRRNKEDTSVEPSLEPKQQYQRASAPVDGGAHTSPNSKAKAKSKTAERRDAVVSQGKRLSRAARLLEEHWDRYRVHDAEGIDCPVRFHATDSQLAEFVELCDEEGETDVLYAWCWYQALVNDAWYEPWEAYQTADHDIQYRSHPVREFLRVASKYLEQVRWYIPYTKQFNPALVCFLLTLQGTCQQWSGRWEYWGKAKVKSPGEPYDLTPEELFIMESSLAQHGLLATMKAVRDSGCQCVGDFLVDPAHWFQAVRDEERAIADGTWTPELQRGSSQEARAGFAPD